MIWWLLACGVDPKGGADSAPPGDSPLDSAEDSTGDSPFDSTGDSAGDSQQDSSGDSEPPPPDYTGRFAGVTSVAEGAAIFSGEMGDSQLGHSVWGGGDLDGDGLDDVLIGASDTSLSFDTAGAVYLLSGPMDIPDLSGATARFVGETSFAHLGHSVSAGDINGDGALDLLMGAYGDATVGPEGGAAYVMYGPVTSFPEENLGFADVRLYGEPGNGRAGYWVDVAPDVTGDGHDDLLIGAPNEFDLRAAPGDVWVVPDPGAGSHTLSTAAFRLSGAGDWGAAGAGVGGAGDVNGDGVGDVLIGAIEYGADEAGAVFLVEGPITADRALDDADALLTGEAARDCAGRLATGVGDLDGDGYDAVLLGACDNDGGAENGGAFYLYDGPELQSGSLGDAPGIFLGASTDAGAGYHGGGGPAGDINADGHPDLVLAAPHEDDGAFNAGAVYIVLGPDFTGTHLLPDRAVGTLLAELSGDLMGNGVSTAGDANGDGFLDIVAGGGFADRGENNTGVVYIVWGGP